MSPPDPPAPATAAGDRVGLDVLVAVAAGGVLGAEARYGLSRALRHPAGTWPWATLLTNVSGCLLIGVLLVVLLERARPAHRLARPFLGVGVLGGFTTFSTFALDVDTLVHHGRAGVAVAYLAASLAGGVAAAALGTAAARRVVAG